MLETILPVISKARTYQLFRIETLPVLKEGYFTNDWKEVEVDDEYVLVNELEARSVKMSDLECLEHSHELPCQICHLKRDEKRPVSECIRSILHEEDPETSCEFEKLSTVANEFVQISESQVAFTDIKPGVVHVNCPGRDRESITLPTTGVLNVNKSCRYQIVNGPMKPGDVTFDNVEVISPEDLQYSTVADTRGESKLQRHFKQNVFEYVLGLSVSLGTVVIAIICYCTCTDGRPWPRPQFRLGWRSRRIEREAVRGAAQLPLISIQATPGLMARVRSDLAAVPL